MNLNPHPLIDPILERSEIARAEAAWLKLILSQQCLDGSVNDGAFSEGQTGWFDGRHAAYTLGRLIANRCWAGEISFDTARLDESIRRCMRFVRRRQHPDGRLDLGGAYSPNEVGFPMSALANGYRTLTTLPVNPLPEVCADLKEFLLLGAEALLKGSAFTANHRWTAASAPLAAVYSLWPDPRYLAKIEDYLADGIDCDKDGCWYEERSPNYNMVADMGLMIMADSLGRPELLRPVVRSLEFILYCLQPNGEMCSTFSHRQDRAQANCPPVVYSVARRTAQISGDGRFTTLALNSWQNSGGDGIIPLAHELNAHPEAMPRPEPLPTKYKKYFASVPVARWRDEDAALTLSADKGGHFFDTVKDQWGGAKLSDDWFHFHYGDIVIESIHLGGAGMTNIQPQTLEEVAPDHYALGGVSPEWLHTLHFRPGRPTLRIAPHWSHQIQIQRHEDGIEFQIDTDNETSLYASLRIWLRPGLTIQDGEGAPQEVRAGETIMLEGGHPVTLRTASHCLRINGLPVAAHRVPLQNAQGIPSRMPQTCGCLCLGLLFPVQLKARLTW